MTPRFSGSTFLKSVPKWVSGQTNVQFMPTLEESVFDRNAGTLITHTRNASWIHTLNMTEKCFYRKIVSIPLNKMQINKKHGIIKIL
jgi:hypothetical protein